MFKYGQWKEQNTFVQITPINQHIVLYEMLNKIFHYFEFSDYSIFMFIIIFHIIGKC